MKNNLLKLLILFALGSMLFSCTVIYTANSGIDPIVFTKPAFKDSITTNTYVGGKFNYSDYISIYDNLDNSFHGQAFVFQTYTERHFNTSYGAFGYYGKMGVLEDNQRISKDYLGGGISGDVQLTIPISNIILKPFGIKTSVLYEDGPYYNYKRTELSSIGFVPDRLMANISQTAGLYYIFKNSSIGADFSAGYSYTFPHLFMDFTYSAILIYNAPRFSVFVQKSGALTISSDELAVGFNIKL